MEKLKCNPLACLTVMFTFVFFLFGSIKADVVEIRKVVYEILGSQPQKIAQISPTTQKLAQLVSFPDNPKNN